MNKREKEITKAQLTSEKNALTELKAIYEQARKDVEAQISNLNARTDMQNLQSIIHQKQYQEAILKQIEGVLNDLNTGQYNTMNDFFNGSYVNGYIGSMYDLHHQGIPIIMPIDQKNVERAIKTDSKLSARYYQNRILPENLTTLKKSIRTELTRGISSGKTWLEMAHQVATGMNSPFKRAMSDATRIMRTEGHRIQQQGFLDAGTVAKEKGADILKQWDATLDNRTRPWHREADGQIREWDDYFIVNGEEMEAPSIGGSASNVINCRCQLLQRARWALDEAELDALKERAEFFDIDKSDSFEDFKDKYLNLPKDADKIKLNNPILMNLQLFAKGKERAETYSSNWGTANLKDVVKRFVPDAQTSKTNSGKILYTSDNSDYIICYDVDGDYFRIESKLLSGKRRYLDINGENVTNINVDGKIRGRSKEEYESITHFKNVKTDGDTNE